MRLVHGVDFVLIWIAFKPCSSLEEFVVVVRALGKNICLPGDAFCWSPLLWCYPCIKISSVCVFSCCLVVFVMWVRFLGGWVSTLCSERYLCMCLLVGPVKIILLYFIFYCVQCRIDFLFFPLQVV